MAKKASRSRPKPTRKGKGSKRGARPARPAKKTVRATLVAKPHGALAQRMTAFSEKVREEEEAPVAVRSFSEARAGLEGSKVLVPSTGRVEPADSEEESEEDDEEDAGEPQMKPILGQMALPRTRQEAFQPPRATKRGTKVATPDDFGQIELRQATASGEGKHLAHARAENLQRGASRIGALASPGAPPKAAKARPRADEEFDVARPGAGRKNLESLADFGDVEIDQQTLSGSRKLGKLRKDRDE